MEMKYDGRMPLELTFEGRCLVSTLYRFNGLLKYLDSQMGNGVKNFEFRIEPERLNVISHDVTDESYVPIMRGVCGQMRGGSSLVGDSHA